MKSMKSFGDLTEDHFWCDNARSFQLLSSFFQRSKRRDQVWLVGSFDAKTSAIAAWKSMVAGGTNGDLREREDVLIL